MQTPNIASEPAQRLAFTREETAALIGVTASTIDRLTKRKQLRPSRAIRRPLYALDEIRRFLRETTVELQIREDGLAEL
ncbi:MAG: hypothetical protein NTV08_00320 [Verrucomicrobia bacterium]|nr:hypothetical protein [Verrucomicrobiota bacterium]